MYGIHILIQILQVGRFFNSFSKNLMLGMKFAVKIYDGIGEIVKNPSPTNSNKRPTNSNKCSIMSNNIPFEHCWMVFEKFC